MSASDGNNKKITFEEIAPDWSKRLNKLTTAKGISYEKDTMYSDISDYKKCVVGEAYGHIAITKRLRRDAEWHKSEKNTGWNGEIMNI